MNVNHVKKIIKIILAISILIIIFKLSLTRIPGSDVWLYLNIGKDIIQKGKFPTGDTYSFTAYGKPWMAHEWLSGTIFYLIYKTPGENALFYFNFIILAITFLLIFYFIDKKTNLPFIAFLITVTVAFTCTNYFDIRSRIFTYLFTVVTIMILEIERKKLLILLLPIILILWVNLHGGFVVFFIIIFFHILNSWEIIKDKNYPEITPVITGTIISILAIGLNPYSYRLLLYPIAWSQNTIFKKTLQEWQPLRNDENGYYLYIIVIAITAILSLMVIKKGRIGDILAIIFFTYLSMTARRHIPILCLYFAFIMGTNVFYLLPKIPFFNIEQFRRLLFSILIFLLSGAYLLSGPLTKNPFKYVIVNEIFPYKACDFISKSDIKYKTYNFYAWGSFITWKLSSKFKVFIDGRANTIYPEKVYIDYMSIENGKDDYENILKKYKVISCLVTQLHPVSLRLLENSKWDIVFADEISLLFIKKENTSGITKNLMPYAFYLKRAETYEMRKAYFEAIISLKIAERMEPEMAEINIKTGDIFRTIKQNYKAIEEYNKGISKNPSIKYGHYRLGEMYEIIKDREKALEEYKLELKNYPGDKNTLQKINSLK